MASSFLVSMGNPISPSRDFHRRFNQARKAPSTLIRAVRKETTQGDGTEGMRNSIDPHKEQLKRTLLQGNFSGHHIGFTSSGEKALEAIVKCARDHQIKKHGSDADINFIVFKNDFLETTLSQVAEPSELFEHDVEYGDTEAARDLFSKAKFAAVFVEPVHLNCNGSVETTEKFLKYLHDTCNSEGALLVFDESVSGFGRTGKLWAHEAYGVSPHMMAINAPPSSKGLTMGALIVPEGFDLSDYDMDLEIFIETNEYLSKISDDVTSTFLADVLEKGNSFVKELKRDVKELDVNHIGLLVEIELPGDGHEAWGFYDEASKISGIKRVITRGDHTVIRLFPPTTLSLEELLGYAKKCATLLLGG